MSTDCQSIFLAFYFNLCVRLNSSLDSIVKKINKNKLMDIKHIWDNEQNGKKRKLLSLSPSSSKTSSPSAISTTSTNKKIVSITKISNTSGTSSDNNKILENILQHILQPQSKNIQQVIAVTLHESSYNELPCWDDDDYDDTWNDANSTAGTSKQICFFLGAVRDMYKSENRMLRQVCNNAGINNNTNNNYHIPLLRIRLGPVSEFTSKILSVLSYHIAHNRLILAIQRHIARNQSSSFSIKQNTIKSTTSSPATTDSPSSTTLHFICHVPLSSQHFTTDVKNRNRLLWCMVRCTVTCLWRSRLAGEQYNKKNSTSTNDHNSNQNHNGTSTSQPSNSTISIINRLSFIFDDGTIILTFNQNDLVSDMAEQHHAAPSEYQILCMIQNKLNQIYKQQEAKQKQNAITIPSISNIQHDLFYDTKTNQLQLPSIGIDFLETKAPISIDDFYFYKSINHDKSITNHSNRIAIFIPLLSNINHVHNISTHIDPSTSIQNAIWKACINQQHHHHQQKENNFIVVPGHHLIHIGDNCIDCEGATITMLQHLAYQGRLVHLLSLCS
jgi:hypothetical protein